MENYTAYIYFTFANTCNSYYLSINYVPAPDPDSLCALPHLIITTTYKLGTKW